MKDQTPEQLTQAQKILEEKVQNLQPKNHEKIIDGNGSNSGDLMDSSVSETTSKSYLASLNQHTTMSLTSDSSLEYSTQQLKLLRKKEMLTKKLKHHVGTTRYARDVDQIYISNKDIPDFKDEVQISRGSFYRNKSPFNPVVSNGRRVTRSA